MQSGPWPESEGEERVDRPNPMTVIAGGEGLGAREPEGLRPHLLTCLGAVAELGQKFRWGIIFYVILWPHMNVKYSLLLTKQE